MLSLLVSWETWFWAPSILCSPIIKLVGHLATNTRSTAPGTHTIFARRTVNIVSVINQMYFKSILSGNLLYIIYKKVIRNHISFLPFPNFVPEHEIRDAGHAPSQKTKKWVGFSLPLSNITQLTRVTTPPTKTFLKSQKSIEKRVWKDN